MNSSRGVSPLELLSVSDWTGIDPEMFILQRASNCSCSSFVVRRRSQMIISSSVVGGKEGRKKGRINTLENISHVGSSGRVISDMLWISTRLMNVSLIVLRHLDFIFGLDKSNPKPFKPSDLHLRLRQSKPLSRHSTAH